MRQTGSSEHLQDTKHFIAGQLKVLCCDVKECGMDRACGMHGTTEMFVSS